MLYCHCDPRYQPPPNGVAPKKGSVGKGWSGAGRSALTTAAGVGRQLENGGCGGGSSEGCGTCHKTVNSPLEIGWGLGGGGLVEQLKLILCCVDEVNCRGQTYKVQTGTKSRFKRQLSVSECGVHTAKFKLVQSLQGTSVTRHLKNGLCRKTRNRLLYKKQPKLPS